MGLRLKPVAVPAEVERSKLVACLSDEIALANHDLIPEPLESFALGAVAPANDRAARAEGSDRKAFEP